MTNPATSPETVLARAAAGRDPLAAAAAAIATTEGLATKPCEACFNAGRPLSPPDVYVARRIGGPNADECFVVYECPHCGAGSSYPIPAHMLLAADVRADPLAGERAAETSPRFYYRMGADETEIEVYADPADGRPPIKVATGRRDGVNVRRLVALLDLLAGGSARE